MLIYILHNDKFYTFRLPKNVSGNYVLKDYDIYGKESITKLIDRKLIYSIKKIEKVGDK